MTYVNVTRITPARIARAKVYAGHFFAASVNSAEDTRRWLRVAEWLAIATRNLDEEKAREYEEDEAGEEDP